MFEMDVHLSWITLFLTSIFSIIFFIFMCICWKERKRLNQSYAMNSDTIRSTSAIISNTVPHISGKQKYVLHDVQYSSINNSTDLSCPSYNLKSNDHFSYNILRTFKNIQNSKFSNISDDTSQMLPDTLEDSTTDAMHKNFDKSVLCLQWNETSESNLTNERDDTYSCISTDSKTTFKSVIDNKTSLYSLAKTFKSTYSDN